MAICDLAPLSAFQGTFQQPVIKSFERLANRINLQLGAPMVMVELHRDQIYENITIALEMFSKFAGYKETYLVFDSSRYIPGYGLKLDQLLVSEYDTEVESKYDDLLENYRKVRNVFDFVEGSTQGVNTLFTIEQTLAQQTYFSYAMGNFGFDLVSWYVLKNWLEVREKVLAINHNWLFNPDTQILKLWPEPGRGTSSPFYGVIGVYLEDSIKEMIKQPWVQQYALALSKLTLANSRGKYSGTNLFGGGQINFNDLQSQGVSEKDKLEQDLYNGAAPGASAYPASFFVG